VTKSTLSTLFPLQQEVTQTLKDAAKNVYSLKEKKKNAGNLKYYFPIVDIEEGMEGSLPSLLPVEIFLPQFYISREHFSNRWAVASRKCIHSFGDSYAV